MPLDSTPLLFATPERRRPLRADFTFDTTWWHAGGFETIAFNPKTCNGGFHLGTYAQATDRKRSGDRLSAFHVALTRTPADKARWQWAMDCGEGWDRVCVPARRKGRQAVVYLNRFEGFQDADVACADDVDHLPDSQFRRLYPQADWSLIVMDGAILRPLDALATKHTLRRAQEAARKDRIAREAALHAFLRLDDLLLDPIAA